MLNVENNLDCYYTMLKCTRASEHATRSGGPQPTSICVAETCPRTREAPTASAATLLETVLAWPV